MFKRKKDIEKADKEDFVNACLFWNVGGCSNT